MKPKPFASLNHFTVPRATVMLLENSGDFPGSKAVVYVTATPGHRGRVFSSGFGPQKRPPVCVSGGLDTSDEDPHATEDERDYDRTRLETSSGGSGSPETWGWMPGRRGPVRIEIPEPGYR